MHDQSSWMIRTAGRLWVPASVTSSHPVKTRVCKAVSDERLWTTSFVTCGGVGAGLVVVVVDSVVVMLSPLLNVTNPMLAMKSATAGFPAPSSSKHLSVSVQAKPSALTDSEDPHQRTDGLMKDRVIANQSTPTDFARLHPSRASLQSPVCVKPSAPTDGARLRQTPQTLSAPALAKPSTTRGSEHLCLSLYGKPTKSVNAKQTVKANLAYLRL